MTDAERAIRAEIVAHETSYAQKHSGTAIGAWRWMCSCGESCDLCSWAECRDKTHDHWAKMLLPLWQAATEQAVMQEHANHTQFAADMYSTLIDPCATGSMKEAELQTACLKAARDNRQALYDAQDAIAGAYEAAAKLVERIVFQLESCDSHNEYQEAQVLKPLIAKLRALTPADARQAQVKEVESANTAWAAYQVLGAIFGINTPIPRIMNWFYAKANPSSNPEPATPLFPLSKDERNAVTAALASAEARGRLGVLREISQCKTEDDTVVISLAWVRKELAAARSLTPDAPCSTCNGEGTVESKPAGTGHDDDLAEHVPCPNCKRAPDAQEQV